MVAVRFGGCRVDLQSVLYEEGPGCFLAGSGVVGTGSAVLRVWSAKIRPL